MKANRVWLDPVGTALSYICSIDLQSVLDLNIILVRNQTSERCLSVLIGWWLEIAVWKILSAPIMTHVKMSNVASQS